MLAITLSKKMSLGTLQGAHFVLSRIGRWAELCLNCAREPAYRHSSYYIIFFEVGAWIMPWVNGRTIKRKRMIAQCSWIVIMMLAEDGLYRRGILRVILRNVDLQNPLKIVERNLGYWMYMILQSQLREMRSQMTNQEAPYYQWWSRTKAQKSMKSVPTGDVSSTRVIIPLSGKLPWCSADRSTIARRTTHPTAPRFRCVEFSGFSIFKAMKYVVDLLFAERVTHGRIVQAQGRAEWGLADCETVSSGSILECQ